MPKGHFRAKSEREAVVKLIAKHWGTGYTDGMVVQEFNQAHPESPIHARNVRYYRLKNLRLQFYKRRKNRNSSKKTSSESNGSEVTFQQLIDNLESVMDLLSVTIKSLAEKRSKIIDSI